MPRSQQPSFDDNFGFEPLGINPIDDDFGFEPLSPPSKSEPKSWYEDILTVPNLMRFGGSALGDIAGGAAAMSGYGLPATIPLIVGGGALGEAGARWWEGKPFDPTITALEGGLNLLPGAGGIPGKGAGLRAIGKYALKSAGHGAAQGFAGAFPRHQAERGELWSPSQWEMPSLGEVGSQTLGGGVIGGALGTAFGASNVIRQNRLGQIADARIQPLPEGLEQGDLGLEGGLREPELPFPPRYIESGDRAPQVRPTEEPYFYDYGPQQQKLPLESSPSGPPGQAELFDLGKPPTMADLAPVAEPVKLPPITGPEIVDVYGASPAETSALKQQGYEPYKISPQGHALWIRRTSTEAPTPTTTLATPTEATPAGIPLGEEITLPNPAQPIIDQMRENGYEITNIGPNRETTFKVKDPSILQRLMTEDIGTSDPQEMWTNLKRLLGRDPTPDEVEQGMRRQVQPGERIEPAEMRVPGTARGGGLENIAIGPQMEDTRLLDVIGTSLYTRDRPATVVKELLQNSVDELKISGNQGPIRIGFRYKAEHPVTGNDAHSIVVKDFGRGMSPAELYTIFTDVGKTGKGGIAEASGGFGFAKAAPLLGGDYVKIESITRDVDTGDIVKYTFGGDPTQLKNQKVGVQLIDELMDPNTPTGFKVEVFFPKDRSLHQANTLLNQTVEGTPNLKGIEVFEDYNKHDRGINEFLEKGQLSPSVYGQIERPTGLNIPPQQSTISTSGADVDIHFELDNLERRSGTITYLNNGLFASSDRIGYGQQDMPHVPGKIVANIRATVEEGAEGYPFGANREQLNVELAQTIKKWINDNVVQGAEAKRVDELQKVFDALRPTKNNFHVIHDSGSRYTPQELKNLENNPQLKTVAHYMGGMLDRLDSLFPVGTPGGQIGKTAKFGWNISDPDKGGLNIPSPKAPSGAREFAILVNPLGAIASEANPAIAAEKIAHVILHEFNHNIVRSEGSGFTWQLLQTDSKFGTQERANVSKAILKSITGPSGDYAPEIQKLLQEYTAARGRPDATIDTLSRQRESEWLGRPEQGRVPDSDQVSGEGTTWQRIKEKTGISQGGAVPPGGKKKGPTLLENILGVPTVLTTTGDYSAALRQGMSSILTKEYWSALGKMVKGGMSPEQFKAIDDEIRAKPIFQRHIDPTTGKIQKSFAEQIGLKLIDSGSDVGASELSAATRWVETGGNIPGLSAAYSQTVGRYARGSNRAYATFLNHLRANRLESLLDNGQKMSMEALTTGSARPGFLKQQFTPEQALELNPYKNTVLAKELANFVNTSTGRGSLGKLEGVARELGMVFFAPRLLASRLRMMNPATYAMASPMVRKQYMGAAFATAAAWFTMAKLGEMAGAEVSSDPTSADFGKMKFGNTRLDPGGGFQQFLVDYARIWYGGVTSSATNEWQPYGEGFRAETQRDTQMRFLSNKLNPIAKFAWDLAGSSQYMPFHVKDRVAQLFVPLFIQDAIELFSEDPSLIPMLAPVVLGMGTQTYEKGESVGKLVAPENDWLVTGGGLRDLVGMGDNSY